MKDKGIKEISEEPAFPIDPQSQWTNLGITKREYFAAMALQGMLANPVITQGYSTEVEKVEQAFAFAKAMIWHIYKTSK